MIKSLFNNKIYGVNIHFLDQESVSITWCIIEKSKDEVKLLETNTSTSMEAFLAEASLNLPFVVQFSGKGVMSKSVKKEGFRYSDVIFNQNVDDFLFTEYHEQKQLFISFIRKSIVDEYVAFFTKQKKYCVKVSVGPFIAATLVTSESNFYSNSNILTFENKELQRFSKYEETEEVFNTIGSVNYDQFQTSVFALALNYWVGNEKLIVSDYELIAQNGEEFLFRNLFNRIGAGVLIFFFLLLTSSYLFLNHYNDKLGAFLYELGIHEDSFNQLKVIETNIYEKENMLKESGILSDKYLSFYVQEIAKKCNKRLAIQELNVFPVAKKIKKSAKIKVHSNKVVVKGEVVSSFEFNKWIKLLKEDEWVSRIEIIDYEEGSQKRDKFFIEIYI